MIAFEIEIDGQTHVVAGVEDWDLLTLHLDAARGKEGSIVPDDNVRLAVGALTLPEADGHRRHLRWQEAAISVGANITIRIVDRASADQPSKRFRSDSEVQEDPFTDEEAREMRFQSFLELKAEFEPSKR